MCNKLKVKIIRPFLSSENVVNMYTEHFVSYASFFINRRFLIILHVKNSNINMPTRCRVFFF